MAHHGNVDINYAPDGLGYRDAAFELDRFGAALLDQAPGVGQRVLYAHLIGQERQVGDHQRALARPRDHPGVVDDLVEGDASVLSAPCTTIPRLSPTSSTSTPAASKMRANGKSYAVSIAIGVRSAFIRARSVTRTFSFVMVSSM
jgi:hypothetical protein